MQLKKQNKPKACLVEECKRSLFHGSNGYCSKHWHHMRKYGRILARTRKDKNEIVFCGDYCEVILYARDGETEKARTKVDASLVSEVENIKWCLSDQGYAIAGSIKRVRGRKRLHHYILRPKDGFEIDHINGDKLDNRLSNLRYSTHKENCSNRYDSKGYSWDKARKKWMARIFVNRKQINLGRFDKEEDAIKARREGELKYFGEFARKV